MPNIRRVRSFSLFAKSISLSLFVILLAVLIPSAMLGRSMTSEIRASIKPTLQTAIASAWGYLYNIHGTALSADGKGMLWADGNLINGNFEAIDKAKDSIHGVTGTATIFVRVNKTNQSPAFCRIATNVMTRSKKVAENCKNISIGEKEPFENGLYRATGTELEVGNRAYNTIMDGKTFSGKISILGQPYFTVYQPIYGTNTVSGQTNELIGILYVGIRQSDLFAAVKKAQSTIFLTAGVTALVLLLLLFVMYQRMFKPLRQLISAMIRLDRGDTGVVIHGTELSDEIGDMARALVALKNNTIEKEKLASQTSEARERLQQAMKMEAVGTLAGGIAHDFNNILTAIQGHCWMIMDHFEPSPQTMSSVRQIKNAANRAISLVRQLLEFSRREETSRKPVAIERIVDEVYQLVRVSVPTSIEIDWKKQKTPGHIMADTGQLHQVLLNLLYNAADAIGSTPGTITISTDSVTSDDKIFCFNRALPPGHYALVSIVDSGCGMDEHTLERAFDPFFTTKDVDKGTGLGLAAVHGILDSHDGGVSVESSPGKGTKFKLFFPLIDQEENQNEQLHSYHPTGTERLLFVDDDKQVLDAFTLYLKELGYTIESVTNPNSAVALVKADPEEFDLVVTDQVMPGLTGLQLARKLNDIKPELPIILCSGYSSELADKTKKPENIRAVVGKPIKPVSLAATIRHLLDGRPKL